MAASLNINLLIPFKDNRGERLKLYRREIERFREELDLRVEEMRQELTELFGKGFDLTIAARSDGTAKKHYWRFKTSKRDRKYNRLQAASIKEYLSSISDARKLRLREIEEELIYINANLKLIKGMIDAIEQSKEELQSLRHAEM